MLRRISYIGATAAAMLGVSVVSGCGTNSRAGSYAETSTAGQQLEHRANVQRERARLVQRGERAIADGQAMVARGQAMVDQGNNVEGQRLIIQGESKIREGNMYVQQAQNIQLPPTPDNIQTAQPYVQTDLDRVQQNNANNANNANNVSNRSNNNADRPRDATAGSDTGEINPNRSPNDD
jgi:hypothetical protein